MVTNQITTQPLFTLTKDYLHHTACFLQLTIVYIVNMYCELCRWSNVTDHARPLLHFWLECFCFLRNLGIRYPDQVCLSLSGQWLKAFTKFYIWYFLFRENFHTFQFNAYSILDHFQSLIKRQLQHSRSSDKTKHSCFPLEQK